MVSSDQVTIRADGTTGQANDSHGDLLTQVWSRSKDIAGWLTAVNHRTIGIRYIVTAFIFFVFLNILGFFTNDHSLGVSGAVCGEDSSRKPIT